MNSLLSFKARRLINIVELLVLTNGPVWFEDIIETNKCSLRTVYADINYLSKFYDETLNLKIESKKLRSHSKSFRNIESIKQDILKREISIRILLNIYFNPNKILLDHSLELDFSESQIKNYIRKINKFLVRYDLHISYNTRDHGYKLESSTDKTINRILFITELLYVLEDEGIVFKYLGGISTFDENHAGYVSLPLDLQRYYDLSYRVRQFDELNYHQKLKYSETYQYFKNAYQEILEISLDKARSQGLNAGIRMNIDEFHPLKESISLLFYRASILPTKLDNIANRFEHFYQYFCQENKNLVGFYESFIFELEKKLNISCFSYKEELLFIIYTNLPNVRQYKYKEIGVFSDKGKSHAKALVLKIKKHFSIHNIEVFQDSKVAYDLCVMTCRKKILNCKKIILISDYPSAFDLKKIYESLYLD